MRSQFLGAVDARFGEGTLLRICAAAAAGAVLLAIVAFTQAGPGLAPPGLRVEYGDNPELARIALSERARWRAQPSLEQARAYSDALFAAGMEDEVVAELANGELLAEAPIEAAALRAEALLRLGRFDDAISAADALPQKRTEAFAAFVRARALYARTGDAKRAEADLLKALAGGPSMAPGAWMFRSRLALDANDAVAAEAASRRASETGVSRREMRLALVENEIRAGRLELAERELAAIRSERKGRAALLKPADESRLQAMIAVRRGDYKSAASLYSATTAQTSMNPADLLLAALIRHLAGDHAAAESTVRDFLLNAPGNWVALDLGQAIADAQGDEKEAAALRMRLAAVRPSLGAGRIYRAASRAGDHDAALAAARAANSGDTEHSSGTLTRLIGAGVSSEAPLGDLNAGERAFFAAASLAPAASNREKRRAAKALTALDSRPAASIAAATLFLEIGAPEEAAPLIRAARRQAPSMRAAAHLDAKLAAERGDIAGARAIWREFLAANPADADAHALAARFELDAGDVKAAAALVTRAPAAVVYRDARLAEAAFRAASGRGQQSLAAAVASAHLHADATDVASALLAAGLYAEAAVAARSALSENPKDDRAPAIYLQSMTRTGARAEAMMMLTAIQRRYPDARAAAEALERAERVGSAAAEG
jgi:tetratricopeptide (TPR) repeat protein